MMILYDAGKDFGGFGTIKTAQTTIFFMRLRFVCTVQCIGKHDNVKDRVIVCIIHLGHSGLRVFFGACTSRDELRSIASLNGAICSFSVHTHHTHTHTHTQTALDLHILADRYGFPHLKDGIESHLSKIITPENVLLFHSHAKTSSAPLLQEKCEVFMDLHAGEVIASTALQRLPKENLKKLIARDTFVVEEIQIFEAVRKWMETNGVRKEGASELLECVRLTEIPQAELEAKVLPTGLFARARVLAAMGEGEPVEIATRGRTSK